MTESRLLITGATGFIGSRVLLDALEAGWSVRITARTEDKLQKVLANTHMQPFTRNIETCVIPDLLATGAHQEALRGVTHVIHAATPLPFPTDNPTRDIFRPSVEGTTNLLQDALDVPTVQRVVVTSSLVANMPYPPPEEPITASDRVPDPSPEQLDESLDFFTAYRYGKILALNRIEQFRRNSNAHFDVVNVIPGFVHGASLLATADTVLKGSNRLLLVTLLGQQLPPPRLAGAAHIDDVAKVHICALDDNVVPRNSNIDLAIAQPVVYDQAWDIVSSAFPKAVEKGIFRKGGQPSLKVNYDVAGTLQRCKIEMKTYTQMVQDTVRQYLEFQGVPAA